MMWQGNGCIIMRYSSWISGS